MRLGIDTFACDGGKSGVGIYLSQLLRRIPPSGAYYELVGWEDDRFAYSEAAPDLEFIPQGRAGGKVSGLLWYLLQYRAFAKNRNWDACFFPAAHRRFPPDSPCPTVGVVHDVPVLWGPVSPGLGKAGAFLRPFRWNPLFRLDRIIAVSGWVKEELLQRTGVKESKIAVIPNGIDLRAFYPRPRSEESSFQIQPFSFRRPYILYASRIGSPGKNHIRLIEAFGLFRERTRYPHRLVLAGARSRGAERVIEVAGKSPYRNDIFFTGHFPAKNLPELYAGADMVVIPSLREGFGMGVLEAMASGVPVACARAASLPETAEHAALYFNPRSSEDMADRMITLSANRELARECRRLGLERVQSFSWDRSAEATFRLLQEAAGT
jgi:glycosyltransferase involved in cell wall biosynthesis